MNPDLVDVARNRLKSETEGLSNLVATSTKRISAAVSRLRREKSSNSVPGLLRLLSGELSQLAKEADETERLAAEWDHFESVEFLELEATLYEICSKHGWRLGGSWPEFIVEFGVLVGIDEADHMVRVRGKAVDVSGIEQCLSAEVKDLLPKSFSPAGFMSKIAIAYDKLSTPESSQVPVLELYRQVVIDFQSARFWRDATGSQFTAMSLDQFRCQFSSMLEAGVSTTTDGRTLRLFPPLNPKNAIFMFQPAERRFGFVGRIELMR